MTIADSAQKGFMYTGFIVGLLDGVSVANNNLSTPAPFAYVPTVLAATYAISVYFIERDVFKQQADKLLMLDDCEVESKIAVQKQDLENLIQKYQRTPQSKPSYVLTTTGKTSLSTSLGFVLGYGLVTGTSLLTNYFIE